MTHENNNQELIPKPTDRHGIREFIKRPIGKVTVATVSLLATGGLIFGGAKAMEQSGDGVPSTSAPTNPTENPTQTTTPSPETPFTRTEWIIDRSQFDAWDSMDRTSKRIACNNFFADNPADTDVVAAIENTGIEIAQYYDATLDVIYNLHKDKSNETNLTIAEKLAECVTTVHGTDEGSYRTELLRLLDEISNSNLGLKQQRVDNVTRYSDGLQIATDHNGITYNYKAVEYNIVDEYDIIPDTIRQSMFEWTADGKWQKIVEFSSGVEVKYGKDKPPIVLDPTRADAPWK